MLGFGPDKEFHYMQQGEKYYKKGDYDSALSYLEKATGIPYACRLIKKIYQEKGNHAMEIADYAKATEYFEKAINAVEVPIAKDFKLLGIAYLKAGLPDKAISAFQQALEITPHAGVKKLIREAQQML